MKQLAFRESGWLESSGERRGSIGHVGKEATVNAADHARHLGVLNLGESPNLKVEVLSKPSLGALIQLSASQMKLKLYEDAVRSFDQLVEKLPSFETFNNRSIALRKLGDRKSTRLNSSHVSESRMPSSA